MENVVLTIHLILALCLIGVVLMQRSEGPGATFGGGNAMTGGRPAVTGLGKLTWFFAVLFIITSLTLTLFAARNAAGTSVVDQFGGSLPAPAPAAPDTPLGGDLLPPVPADAPAAPPRPDAAPAADTGGETSGGAAPAAPAPAPAQPAPAQPAPAQPAPAQPSGG
jgi:preprotein translocase subunit SecG